MWTRAANSIAVATRCAERADKAQFPLSLACGTGADRSDGHPCMARRRFGDDCGVIALEIEMPATPDMDTAYDQECGENGDKEIFGCDLVRLACVVECT